MLERLPNELLAPIFALACTDGGKTAGALRLVSRHLQIIAAPYRFRTVAVAGVDPITDLVELLDHTLPELRIIEHMFVSDKTASELSGYDGRTESMPFRLRAKAKTGHASTLTPLRALLCYASPHAQSLTLLAFKEQICARPLAPIPFPQLQTLTLEFLGESWLANRLIMPRVHTVTLSMPYTMHPSCFFMLQTLRPVFPALERAHVHGPQATWELAFHLLAWVSDGPEHICYDIYLSVPPMEEQTSMVALHVADFKTRLAEQDRPQNNVRFHEPQEIQWTSHYATWRGRWAETENSFSCE
jgi:hypothetical protein